MRTIDMENWKRLEHFNFFNTYDYPHFSMCANMDLTSFYPFIKQHSIAFTVAVMYAISRTANTIPEFRQRIRDGKVVEHETIHPAVTVLIDDDVFTFCTVEYAEDFTVFSARAAERMQYVKENPTLIEEEPDKFLFMTAIPWVSFTSFMHPTHLSPVDSVPRFAWGKFFAEGETLKMPLSVQGHHALMDGLHMGRFYEEIQRHLYHPAMLFGMGG